MVWNGVRGLAAFVALTAAFIGPLEALAHGLAHEHEAHHRHSELGGPHSDHLESSPVLSIAEGAEDTHAHSVVAPAIPPRHEGALALPGIPEFASPLALFDMGHIPATFAI